MEILESRYILFAIYYIPIFCRQENDKNEMISITQITFVYLVYTGTFAQYILYIFSPPSVSFSLFSCCVQPSSYICDCISILYADILMH